MIKIALVDDHPMMRQSLHSFLNMNENYLVITEASNGYEFIEYLKNNELPDIVIMDINMPVMDGFATTEIVTKNYPAVKVIGLSMLYDDNVISRITKSGARGFVTKSSNAEILLSAIDTVAKGSYFIHKNEHIKIYSSEADIERMNLAYTPLSGKEIELIELCTTGLQYDEIAEKLCVSLNVVESWMDALLKKLNIKNRTGLMLYAIKNGIVSIDDI